MLHSLSIFHEQTRPDRDNYISVNYNNLNDGMRSQFDIGPDQDVFDVPYDIESVMHYGAYVGAIDYSTPVMTARNPDDQDKMGNRVGINFNDIKLVHRMYQCAGIIFVYCHGCFYWWPLRVIFSLCTFLF